MTVELTEPLQQALDSLSEPPLRLVDPRSQRTYVLVSAEVYDRLQALLVETNSQEEVDAAYAAAMEVCARDGWNDPRMDVYDELDPRKNS